MPSVLSTLGSKGLDFNERLFVEMRWDGTVDVDATETTTTYQEHSVQSAETRGAGRRALRIFGRPDLNNRSLVEKFPCIAFGGPDFSEYVLYENIFPA